VVFVAFFLQKFLDHIGTDALAEMKKGVIVDVSAPVFGPDGFVFDVEAEVEVFCALLHAKHASLSIEKGPATLAFESRGADFQSKDFALFGCDIACEHTFQRKDGDIGRFPGIKKHFVFVVIEGKVLVLGKREARTTECFPL